MSAGLQANTAPPAFLQLAGHPLRWQLLRELTKALGTPQSLVS